MIPAVSFANGIVPCEGPDCNICHLAALAQRILNFLIILATSVATAIFMYAGFLYLMAGGDPGKVSKAHSLFWNVIVGLVIMLSAWLIVDIFMSVLLNKAFLQNWNTIPGC